MAAVKQIYWLVTDVLLTCSDMKTFLCFTEGKS